MECSVEEALEQTMSVDSQHNKDLGECMIELYKNRLWTDVKFWCKDHDESERIHAHKIVLAARSPVFQAMFFGPCADGKNDVELTNTEAETFDLFLRYIYSDTVTLNKESASAVLEMAHYYQVTNLVHFCADYLATLITPGNACELLTLAMFYKLTTLRDACCSFIDRNADAVLSSEGFLKLPEDCLTYIMKGDTFYADEYNVFLKAEEWSRRKMGEGVLAKTGPNIRKTLGSSFYYLRLPTMTPETLMKCTRKKGYFSVEEYEDIFYFVNKHTAAAPSVTSNSCIARLPKEETLIINHSDGESNICDSIRTIFQISVSRHIKLTNLFVTAIQQHLKYDRKLYTDEDSEAFSIGNNYMNSVLLGNDTKLLKFEPLFYGEGTNSSPYGRTAGAKELKAAYGEDLSDKLGIAISGTLKVTRKRNKLFLIGESNKRLKLKEEDTAEYEGPQDEVSEEEKEIEKEETEEKTDGAVHIEDEDELIFEQDFQLPSSDVRYRGIDLREPLTLTKTASPYKIEITMNYGCTSGVKMKTLCSNTKTVTSKFGQLQLRDIAGQFSGIESIGFENISNR